MVRVRALTTIFGAGMATKPSVKYKVTTTSGRTYLIFSNGNVKMLSKVDKNHAEVFRSWAMVDPKRLRSEKKPDETIVSVAFRVKIEAEEPVVGLCLFPYSFGSWRISTPVEKVERVYEQDEEETWISE